MLVWLTSLFLFVFAVKCVDMWICQERWTQPRCMIEDLCLFFSSVCLCLSCKIKRLVVIVLFCQSVSAEHQKSKNVARLIVNTCWNNQWWCCGGFHWPCSIATCEVNPVNVCVCVCDVTKKAPLRVFHSCDLFMRLAVYSWNTDQPLSSCLLSLYFISIQSFLLQFIFSCYHVNLFKTSSF